MDVHRRLSRSIVSLQLRGRIIYNRHKITGIFATEVMLECDKSHGATAQQSSPMDHIMHRGVVFRIMEMRERGISKTPMSSWINATQLPSSTHVNTSASAKRRHTTHKITQPSFRAPNIPKNICSYPSNLACPSIAPTYYPRSWNRHISAAPN